MTLYTRLCTLGATVTLTAVLTACGTASGPTAAATSTANPTSTASPAKSSGDGMPMPSAPTGPHNQADITFAQMMTVHHQGAIEMADLAPTRAANPKVKDLAIKIKAAQVPEITEMSGWLASWAPETDMNGMPNKTTAAMGGMSGTNSGSSATAPMPGMMSDAQLGQLKAATGTPFDKLFLQLMIAHHQGALEMAKTEKTSGQNPAAQALADSITASQTAEIATMADLLKGL